MRDDTRFCEVNCPKCKYNKTTYDLCEIVRTFDGKWRCKGFEPIVEGETQVDCP